MILPERISRLRVLSLLGALGALALPFADLSLGTHQPLPELLRMAAGFVTPDFGAIEDIGRAIWLTLMFAIAGVALGALVGLAVAPFYHLRSLRWCSIGLRSIHELFWALLLMQVLGLHPATGVLAIALPYAGFFAKVFAEQLDTVDPRPAQILPPKVDALSRFLFARAPLAWAGMRTYALYRLECGLRSSAVLGFIGLPTLGFQLDSFFRVGEYSAASAIMICYVAMIASIRFWMRPRLVALWIGAAVLSLGTLTAPPMGSGALMRFLTQDIVPAPLRNGGDLNALADWAGPLIWLEILPGIVATLVVAQIALVLTGALAFFGFGLIVPRVTGRIWRAVMHVVLVTLRSFPEYILAYLFLQAFGPSMLPAILALALHNGAIIAHLLGRDGAELGQSLRRDAPLGASLWAWEMVPRLFGRFLTLLLYRWEIILRETTVMGLLGVATLGFFVDSALSELRLDRAVVLLVATLVLTACVDKLSRSLRKRIGALARPQRGYRGC